MPLTHLIITGSLVKDISDLKGIPLGWLDLSDTQVQDISILKGMPIVIINLNGSKELNNIKILSRE